MCSVSKQLPFLLPRLFTLCFNVVTSYVIQAFQYDPEKYGQRNTLA